MTTLNRPSNLRGWFVSTEQSEGAKPEDPVFKELLDSVEPIAPATELKARAAYLVEQGDLAVKGDLPDYEKAEGFEENRRLLLPKIKECDATYNKATRALLVAKGASELAKCARDFKLLGAWDTVVKHITARLKDHAEATASRKAAEAESKTEMAKTKAATRKRANDGSSRASFASSSSSLPLPTSTSINDEEGASSQEQVTTTFTKAASHSAVRDRQHKKHKLQDNTKVGQAGTTKKDKDTNGGGKITRSDLDSRLRSDLKNRKLNEPHTNLEGQYVFFGKGVGGLRVLSL